ncbi:MAG: hypothetical protein E6R03_06550 [Hyphomicrobiaceae bacterium]|nr:MAG: hypothetical protein E6R03_06550 [Hyphomicrobiaceae bacterium]
MKRTAIVAALFCVLAVHAQLPGLPGILDPSGLAKQESASGATYLLNETFDSTGYDVAGWTESNTSEIKEDYATAPAPLSGTQSLYFDVTATRTADTPAFTASDTVWISFLFHDDEATLPGGQKIICSIKDSVGGTTVASIAIESDGDMTVACGSATQRSTASLSLNTTFRIWFSYTKGTGANGQAAVYWDTSLAGPKGTAKASVTTGTSTAQAASIRFAGYTDTEWHLDNVQVAATEF